MLEEMHTIELVLCFLLIKICETYPERLIVPKCISDEYLRCSASFRHHNRFPLLSYLHKTSKSCLIRSAQPLSGIHECRCKEDEALINTMLNQRQRKGWILDTRHPSIVKSAQTRGEMSNSLLLLLNM